MLRIEWMAGWPGLRSPPDGLGSYGVLFFTTRLAGLNPTEISRAGDSTIKIV